MICVDFDNLNTLPVGCIQNPLCPSKNMLLLQPAGLDAAMSRAAWHYQMLHLIISRVRDVLDREKTLPGNYRERTYPPYQGMVEDELRFLFPFGGICQFPGGYHYCFRNVHLSKMPQSVFWKVNIIFRERVHTDFFKKGNHFQPYRDMLVPRRVYHPFFVSLRLEVEWTCFVMQHLCICFSNGV